MSSIEMWGGSASSRRRNRPDFHLLEIFLSVAENRSFGATARQMGRSQPAISQAIARLEDIIGGDLFERRHGAPVALTPIGRAILPSARSLLYTIDQQMKRAIATAQSRSGMLTIGIYLGIVSGALHDGIVEFVTEHPDVQLHLVEALPHELQRLLSERAIDIMFAALLPQLASTALVQEHLWDERLVAALREDHPLSARDSLRWNDISGLPLILRSRDGDRSAYRAILARIEEQPINCELHDVSRGALLEMVRMGLGATIFFASAVSPWPGIAFRPIEDRRASAAVEAVWPRSDGNPIRHNLLACVRRHANRSKIRDRAPFASRA